MEDFLKNDYPQTLGRMANNENTQGKLTRNWWPGDDDVVANYDFEQRKRWGDLDTRLTSYIKTELAKLSSKSIFDNLFMDHKAIKITLLARHIEKSGW